MAWSLYSVGIFLWAIEPYPAAGEVRGELAERLFSQGMPTLLVWERDPNLEHFNSCQKIVQDNSNVNVLQYLFAWVIWGRDWLNTKWTRKQLPETTVMLFSASPGNTTLLEMLNLLVRKDCRDHTIYVPLPGNDAKWRVHGGVDMGVGKNRVHVFVIIRKV